MSIGRDLGEIIIQGNVYLFNLRYDYEEVDANAAN